jgi:hypothetical protein
MTYDDWKTETPEDEYWRKHGRTHCEACDKRFADGSYEFNGIWRGVVAHLCEDCAAKRDEESSKPVCEDCEDAIGAWCEDLTGYHPKGGDWLCRQCQERRQDPPEPDREWPQARNE